MTLDDAKRGLIGKRIVNIRDGHAVTDDQGRQTGEIRGDLVLEDGTIIEIPDGYRVRPPGWPLDPRD